MRRVVPRIWIVAFASLFIACAGDEPKASELTRADVPPRAAASSDASNQEVVTHRVDIRGVVATDLDEPLAGRSVVLVDARGARHERVTRGDGSFSVPDVLPPYDVVVAPAAGPVTVHLGLVRADPWLELVERDGPTPSPPSQRIRVGVRREACDGPSCTVTVMTASPSGAGSTTTACDADQDVAVVDVDHRWRPLTVPAGERIDVHVLVAEDDGASFAYARLEGPVAAPGGTDDVGVVEPASVPATDPISISVITGELALTDWRWSTSVFFDPTGDALGTDAGFLFTAAPAAATTVRAPLIPGLHIRANIAASHPRADEQGGFHRSVEVWSGGRALSVDPIALEIAPGPEIVRPAAGGTLSRRGLGFSWRSSGSATPALSTLTIADTTRGGIRFRVLTNGQEVPLARLARLGVSKLELGDHMLDLTTAPGMDAEDALSPDPALRRRRHDRAYPGTATYLRVPFQVTN